MLHCVQCRHISQVLTKSVNFDLLSLYSYIDYAKTELNMTLVVHGDGKLQNH